jgi:hypothetical protein
MKLCFFYDKNQYYDICKKILYRIEDFHHISYKVISVDIFALVKNSLNRSIANMWEHQ